MTRAQVSAVAVFLASLLAAAHLVNAAQGITMMSALCLAVFIVLEWSFLILAARILVVITGVLGFGIWQFGITPPDLFFAASDRAAFLVFFVVSLSVLRDAAQSSGLVRTCGRIVVNQTPGRRYLMLTLGGHLMGILLSMGAVNLLGTMIHQSVAHGQGEPRLREIRLQRMSLAVLRSFCAVPLWAPTSVTIAIVMSSSLSLAWADLLPIGVCAVLIYLALGWLVDRVTFPRPRAGAISPPPRPVLRPFVGLLAIVMVVPVLGGLVARQLEISLIAGLLISVPLIGMGWIAIQYRRAGWAGALRLASRRARRGVLPAFRDLRNEIVIFAASGFLGVILLPQIDVELLSAGIARYGLSEGWVLIAASWAIILLSMISVNPLVTASLAIETLVRLPAMQFDPAVIGFMITMTWAIVVGVTPFSASVRMMGRCINRAPLRIGLGWNLPFSLCLVVLFDAALLMLG